MNWRKECRAGFSGICRHCWECLSAGEDAALAIQLTVGGIQALYGICSIDYSSDISRKLEDWGDNIPVAFPASHGIRILLGPFFADTVTVHPALLLIRGIVDRFQIPGKGLTVFVCYILQGVPHLVDDAALVLGLRESCLDRFTDSGQSVSADDQDILDSAVLEAVQDRKPVLGAFIITHFDRQYFLLSFTVDPKDDIRRQLFDDPVITDGVVDRIDEQDGINLIKGPVLPFLDLWQELVSHIRDEAFRCLKTVDIHKCF